VKKFLSALSISLFAGLLATPVYAIGLDITSLSTTTTTGSTSSLSGVAGGDNLTTGYSPINTPNVLNFQGKTEQVSSFNTANGKSWAYVSGATVSLRSSGSASSTAVGGQNVWYEGTAVRTGQGSSVARTFTFNAGQQSSTLAALQGNNLLVGTENLFTNFGNSQYNMSDIERMDFVIGATTANTTSGFTILERGLTDSHDGFKIAAITGVDAFGNPTSYGSVFTIATGWGTTDLNVPNPNNPLYYVVNNHTGNNPNTATGLGIYSGSPIHVSSNPGGNGTGSSTNNTPQNIGGLFIDTASLAGLGNTIFGYSLFGADNTCSSAQLVNITNTCFGLGTKDFSGSGGLDLVGANLGLVQEVPEPVSTAGLILLGTSMIGAKLKRK